MEGRVILITGASGAIGSALVPVLADNPAAALKLLLRADSTEHLHQRLQGLCHFWGPASEAAVAAGRISGLRGDVEHDRLGLSAEVYADLAAGVTHIIHAAGSVKLNRSLTEARRSAVGSVQHLMALAQSAAERGSFKKLDYLSTVGIAGRTPGLLLEERLPAGAVFRNTYEAAKAEAEAEVWRAADGGLPVTVYRPSMVVGDSVTGKILHFQVFYYLLELLSGRRTLGFLPRLGQAALDIIPVDCVAQFISRSYADPAAAGRIFQLASGPAHRLPLEELSGRVREYWAADGTALPRLRRLPPGFFRALLPLAAGVLRGRTGRRIKHLGYFLDYLEEPQGFDNRGMIAYMAGGGLRLKPPAEYLMNLFAYYRAHRPAAQE